MQTDARDAPDHVEGRFGDRVVGAGHNLLEGLDGLGQGHELAGEDFGDSDRAAT
jgi:hypothetical protein